jgi:hypothetical protein
MILSAAMIWAFATPQQAALRTVGFGFGLTPAPVVVRVHIAGRYAAVLTRGGIMEGSRVSDPILLEHFPFGWQPLEMLNFRCRLDGHHLTAATKARLMRGMPTPKDDRPCNEDDRDVGSPADVNAVRRQMRGPLVPYVVVSNGWAMGEWYGGGGGQTLFQLRHGTWTLVAGVGGAMSTYEMRKYGVPSAAWCALAIYDAACGQKKSGGR